MTYLKRVRWMSCSAVLAALFLFSGNASAIMVTIDNFDLNVGTLVLNFEGDPAGLGSSDDLLEDIELTSFSAVYENGLSTISWGLSDLPTFAYNTITEIVEILYVFTVDLTTFESFTLDINSGLGGTFNGHYADVSNDNFEVLAFTDVIPSPDGEVPAPGTLLLLALGLIAMGGRQMISSRVRLPS